MRYTREQLFDLPLSVLRGLNIESPEEEKLVQEVVTLRVRDLPITDNVSEVSAMTDDMTPEKEAALQAEIDARVAQRTGVSQETVPEEPNEEVVEEVVKKAFCEYCDALGPIKHKANCTRPQ